MKPYPQPRRKVQAPDHPWRNFHLPAGTVKLTERQRYELGIGQKKEGNKQ